MVRPHQPDRSIALGSWILVAVGVGSALVLVVLAVRESYLLASSRSSVVIGTPSVSPASGSIRDRLNSVGSETRRLAIHEVAAWPTERRRELMSDESPHVREAVVAAIKIARDVASIDLVREALRDPDANVRTRACGALTRVGGEECFPLLEEIAKNDPVNFVRAEAEYQIRVLKKLLAEGLAPPPSPPGGGGP